MIQRSPMRVYRPLGLSLAIMAAIVLFAIWPIVKFYFGWRLNEGCFEETGACWGTSFAFDNFSIFIGLLGLLVLISAVLAWRGRPKQMQYIFQAIVLLTSLSLIFEALARTQGWIGGSVYPSSADSLNRILTNQIPFQLLVTLYILWYCNRAPARAFYRQIPLSRPTSEEKEPVE